MRCNTRIKVHIQWTCFWNLTTLLKLIIGVKWSYMRSRWPASKDLTEGKVVEGRIRTCLLVPGGSWLQLKREPKQICWLMFLACWYKPDFVELGWFWLKHVETPVLQRRQKESEFQGLIIMQRLVFIEPHQLMGIDFRQKSSFQNGADGRILLLGGMR